MGTPTEEPFYLIDKDVRGYYPNLILNLKMTPSAMGSAFLKVYKNIVDRRENAKLNKIFSVDKGLKIVVNGTSGKFSDPFSTLYGPDLTIQMTVSGQFTLLMLIEMFELNGIAVISANTDGIVSKVPKSKKPIMDKIIKYWEDITGLVTEETRYSAYYARDCNAYFAVKAGAKSIKDIKVKGPYSEVGSQSGTQLDTNPTAQICTDAVKQLLLDGTAIEETIYNCKDFTRFVVVRQCKAPGAHKDGEYLGKVIRWYYSTDVVGTINTVAANNKIPDSDGAKPCMDMPEEWPKDVDYNWYMQRTIEILYEINYLEKPKQMKLF